MGEGVALTIHDTIEQDGAPIALLVLFPFHYFLYEVAHKCMKFSLTACLSFLTESSPLYGKILTLLCRDEEGY